MEKFLMWLQMIPAIIGLVRAVEAAIPGQGRGKEKLNVVLNTVTAAAEAAPAVANAIDRKDLQGAIIGITNATVSALNEAGALKHGTSGEVSPQP